jgi:hypothetical protein
MHDRVSIFQFFIHLLVGPMVNLTFEVGFTILVFPYTDIRTWERFLSVFIGKTIFSDQA